MGTVARFDLKAIMDKYDTRGFIETGTGDGTGLAHAAKFPFDYLRSVEIEIKLFMQVQERFRDDKRIHICAVESGDFMRWVCRLLPPEQPLVFWLDAHFPGADYGIRPYDDKLSDGIRLPLAEELKMISNWRPYAQDVVICDDLRIYVDGPFQHGNLPENLRSLCPKTRNIDFVYHLMGDTHNVEQIWDHEGYIMITPKVTASGEVT